MASRSVLLWPLLCLSRGFKLLLPSATCASKRSCQKETIVSNCFALSFAGISATAPVVSPLSSPAGRPAVIALVGIASRGVGGRLTFWETNAWTVSMRASWLASRAASMYASSCTADSCSRVLESASRSSTSLVHSSEEREKISLSLFIISTSACCNLAVVSCNCNSNLAFKRDALGEWDGEDAPELKSVLLWAGEPTDRGWVDAASNSLASSDSFNWRAWMTWFFCSRALEAYGVGKQSEKHVSLDFKN